MFAGEGHALHRTLPQAPVLADLAGAVGQVGTTRTCVGAVAAHFVTGERAPGLRIERVQTDQHLIDHLLVAKGLQQAGVVARKVDHHVGAALERRFDPQHAKAGVAEDLTGHARSAFPDGLFELEHHLVAPTVVGALQSRQVLAVQARSHLNLRQGAQRHGHDQVIGLVADAADFDRHALAVLDDRGDRRAGLDGLELLDERLGQYRAATWQTGGAQVAIADTPVHASLLGEIEQRQTRRLIVAGADLLVDQLACGGRQLQFVQPGGDVQLVEGKQGAGGGRVQRVVDRAGQVIEGLLVTLERIGGGRLLGGQVGGAEILAVDQVAGGAHEFGRWQCFKLETVQVLVEHRLALAVADPLAGGQARTAAHAGLGLQQRDLPAFALQLIGRGQACQAPAHDDRRGACVLGQRGTAGDTNQYQRAQAHPSSSHVGELRIRSDRKEGENAPGTRCVKNTSGIQTLPA